MVPRAPEQLVGEARDLGIDLDLGESLDEQLSAAAAAGDVASIQHALAQGADVNHVAAAGRTPLFEAAFYGHAAALATLVDSSAQVELSWTMGSIGMSYTVREIALLCGHSHVVRLLDAVAPDRKALVSAYQRLAWVHVGRHQRLARDVQMLVASENCAATAQACDRFYAPDDAVIPGKVGQALPDHGSEHQDEQAVSSALPMNTSSTGMEHCERRDSNDSDRKHRRKRRHKNKHRHKKKHRQKHKHRSPHLHYGSSKRRRQRRHSISGGDEDEESGDE